jgi:hypothetical protein
VCAIKTIMRERRGPMEICGGETDLSAARRGDRKKSESEGAELG